MSLIIKEGLNFSTHIEGMTATSMIGIVTKSYVIVEKVPDSNSWKCKMTYNNEILGGKVADNYFVTFSEEELKKIINNNFLIKYKKYGKI